MKYLPSLRRFDLTLFESLLVFALVLAVLLICAGLAPAQQVIVIRPAQAPPVYLSVAEDYPQVVLVQQAPPVVRRTVVVSPPVVVQSRAVFVEESPIMVTAYAVLARVMGPAEAYHRALGHPLRAHRAARLGL